MSNLTLLDEHLRTLHLPTMLANYRRVAEDSAEKITYLHALAALEVDRRHENGVRARIAAAHFPVVKTMESFDFALQSAVAESQAARSA
jgi:DNA replication protein DnaC